MVFCNKKEENGLTKVRLRHNPYFNRWFSAMMKKQYNFKIVLCHNPYFNRWFSAIEASFKNCYLLYRVTILILIDGFLQSN